MDGHIAISNVHSRNEMNKTKKTVFVIAKSYAAHTNKRPKLMFVRCLSVCALYIPTY